MILSHRSTALPALGARFELHAAVHSNYRVHFVTNRSVVSEDGLLVRAAERRGHVGRPILSIVLAGRACVRAFGEERWLEPGDATLVANKGAVEMRQEGDTFESLAIEWDPGTFGPSASRNVETGRVQRMGALREAAGVLAASDVEPHAAAAAVHRLFAALSAEGIALAADDPMDLMESPPEHDVRLARALDLALSDLSGLPMVSDLGDALRLSPRQVNRLVADFNLRYGFNASTWRDARSRRRLFLGASFMTAPGATTERVAAAVGYGSPAAFCRALANARLPSPGAVADAVKHLL